ncbi:chaperonin protein [Leptospira ryugenii]|uniref:Chaperonin protein n=1 Tax=Leptospira ryugenii TaxID=1917863 RepID=A0A2P2E0D6_9LEPT|nr:hypothetical protein [Leptospira ryugenii]GBF50342.1 chaperonin protein [Leptospira ryugenii]
MNKSGLSSVASFSAGWTNGIIKQVSILQNGTAKVTIKIDGTQVLSTTPAVTGYVSGNIGIGVGGAEIDLAEILFFDNRVSDQDTSLIECYLGTRYGTSACQ